MPPMEDQYKWVYHWSRFFPSVSKKRESMQALFSTLAFLQELWMPGKFSDGKIYACLFSMVRNVSRSETELVINVRNSNIISHFPLQCSGFICTFSVLDPCPTSPSTSECDLRSRGLTEAGSRGLNNSSLGKTERWLHDGLRPRQESVNSDGHKINFYETARQPRTSWRSCRQIVPPFFITRVSKND